MVSWLKIMVNFMVNSGSGLENDASEFDSNSTNRSSFARDPFARQRGILFSGMTVSHEIPAMAIFKSASVAFPDGEIGRAHV